MRKTHRAVVFTRGKVVVWSPGLHAYWPVWSEPIKVCVVRQSLNLHYQTLLTVDSEAIVVAVVIVYVVVDAQKAICETDDITDTISDVAMRSVKNIVGLIKIDDLQRTPVKLDTRLRKRMNRDLEIYGIRVTQAFFSDVSKPYVVRLIGSAAV